MRVEYSVPGKV